MTIETAREYSATKIMGWSAHELLTDRWVTGDDQRQHKGDWRPDQDRNQLWLVIKECDTATQRRAGYYVGHKDDQCPLGSLCMVAMDKPWYALEAICWAHKEQA